MEYILDDQSTYKKLNKNPTRQLACRINLLIKSWRENGLIDETTYKYLNITNGNLSRCYRLPKIHKTGFSLRIIASSLSPLYNISKYIHDILLNSNLQPRSHIKPSFWLVICFLRAIEKRWNDIAPNTKFNLSQFLYAVEIILDSTSFSFNRKFYEQIFGSTMGSPLSSILTDIMMDDLETHYLDSIDDIFAIVPRAKIDEINVIFNSYHQRLKFTYEIESDSCINFLNTNTLILFEPSKYKINTIFNLVDHAILLSDDQFHDKNIDVVKQILFNNCFPTHVINRYIYKRLNFLKHRVNSIPSVTVGFLRAPSLDSSVGIRARRDDDIGRMFKNMGFTVIYNIPKKLNSLIKRDKDGLPISNRTEVVYKINCKNYSASYIGQTKRYLSTRVKEHFNNIKIHASNLSVISKHKLEFNHDFDWSAPDILHNEKYLRKREIAKMFFIKKFDNTINSQKDTENLNNIYDKLIKVV
ncbi:hypothetical protein ACFW04_014337 [Cataglyphis niger]